MKIGAPDGQAPVGATAPEEASPGDRADAARFEELLEAGAEATQAAGGTPSVSPLDLLHSQIEAGALSGADAANALVDAVVRQYAELLTPALGAELSRELRRLLEEDPNLAALVGRLAGGQP